MFVTSNNSSVRLVHFKLSPVGGDTNRGWPSWAVSPPPTRSTAKRQFEMHPVRLRLLAKAILRYCMAP
ncbi:MAG TPA: hypothetical protein VGP55_11940 [Chitinophagaceae bacterium]|nr:hypothetical protein [Chitinophagaceae bacterium]